MPNYNVSVTYTANGTQTVFSFPFDYLRKAFVYVEKDETTVLTQGTDYSVSEKTVVFPSAPAAGTVLRIYRQTDTTRLVSWADASVLRAKDMTAQQVQELHILEEQQSYVDNNFLKRNGKTWDAKNLPVDNLPYPSQPNHAATMGYVDTLIAGVEATGGNTFIPHDNVESMKRNTNLVPGMTAFTKGYYNPNDGGAGVYTIRTKDVADVDDGGSIIFLDNGNVAELIVDGIVNVKQFGAKGDGTDTSIMFSNLHQFAVAKSLIEDYSGYTDYEKLFANLNGASVTVTLGNATISQTININNSYNYSKVTIANTTFHVACDYVFTLSSYIGFFISFVFENCNFIGDDTHLCYLFNGGSRDIVSPNCINCCFDDVYLVDSHTRYLQSWLSVNCRVQTKNRDFISSVYVIATKLTHLNMEAQPYRLINGCSNIDIIINDSVIEGLTNGVIKTANNFTGGGISVNNTYFETVLYVLQINLPSTLSADSSYRFDFHNDEIIKTVLIDFNGTEKEDFGDHLFLRLSNSYLSKEADSYPSFITCGWRAIKNILVYNNKIVGYNQLFTNSYDVCIHNTETLPTNILGTNPFYVHYKYPESILVIRLDDGSFKYLAPAQVLSNGDYTYKNLFNPSEEFTSTTSKTDGVLNRYVLVLGSIHPLSVIEIPMGQLLVDMPLKNNLYVPLGYL